MGKCFDYGMFGMCPRTKCRFSHKIEHCQIQEFFIAQIISEVREDGGHVISLKIYQNESQLKKSFFLGKGQWYTNEAAQGDFIVFQVSTEQRDCMNLPRGRVLSVLFKDWSHTKSVLEIKESAFTLDPVESRFYDDAITIEKCEDINHSDCNQIGIHIVVAATEKKVSVYDCDRYSNINRPKFKRNRNSFEKGKYRLAMSVYFHTEDCYVTEPEFSVVKVTENYKFLQDKQKYLPDVEILWSHFKNSANSKFATTAACRYMSSTPKVWKELFVLDETMAVFNAGVRKFIEKRPELDAYFITAIGRVYYDQVPNEILVPEELFENSFENFIDKANYSNPNILPILSACKSRSWMRLSIKQFLPIHLELDVGICSDLKEDRVVKFTSPMRNIQHYVNQQVLIHCMAKETSTQLYGRKQMLGILATRFRTPKMFQAVAKTFREKSFGIEFIACGTDDPKVYRIDYATLCDKYDFCTEKLTIFLKNIHCEEDTHYCNKSIVSLDGKIYEKFMKVACGEENYHKMKQYFIDMKESKKGHVSTYTGTKEGTTITLQQTSEIQLQISNDDASTGCDYGVRLLRIGRNWKRKLAYGESTFHRPICHSMLRDM